MDACGTITARVAGVVYERFGACPSSFTIVADTELEAVEKELGGKLPAVYREFLHCFGSRSVPLGHLYGLPRHDMRGDVVMMNHLHPGREEFLLLCGEDGDGRLFFLDTARVGDDGDCPVIIRDRAGRATEVLPGFLQFLARVGEPDRPATAEGVTRV